MSYAEAWGEGAADTEAESVLRGLEEARARPELHLIRSAFESLARFHERRLANGGVSDEALASFRSRLGAALVPVIDLVRRWIIEVSVGSESANDDDQFELCQNRSAMQLLLEDHANNHDLVEIVRDDLGMIDGQLRRICRDYGPVGPVHSPRGLPDSHWWWSCRIN